MNIIIYGEDYCPYCNKAKELFKSLDMPFEYRYTRDYPAEVIALYGCNCIGREIDEGTQMVNNPNDFGGR